PHTWLRHRQHGRRSRCELLAARLGVRPVRRPGEYDCERPWIRKRRHDRYCSVKLVGPGAGHDLPRRDFAQYPARPGRHHGRYDPEFGDTPSPLLPRTSPFMPAPERFSGVLAPVITPFLENLAPDAKRLTAHCRWLSSQGVGLALFGTNSEGNSLSVAEKMELLDRLIEAGIEPARMMPGTGCSALTDSVELTRHAVTSGCGGVLMLPPFYYKGVSDEGLFRSYSEVIERIGSRDLRIYLYHIPPVSQVGISVDLVERLVKAW